MKTRLIPALITLTAGLVACIGGILAHLETLTFLEMVLVVLIIFYVLGCIVKIVLDKNFSQMQENEAEESAADAGQEAQDAAEEEETEKESV